MIKFNVGDKYRPKHNQNIVYEVTELISHNDSMMVRWYAYGREYSQDVDCEGQDLCISQGTFTFVKRYKEPCLVCRKHYFMVNLNDKL